MAKPSGTNLPKAFQSPPPLSLKDGNGGEEKYNALARSGNSGQAPAREARHEACAPFTDTLQGTPRRRRPADRIRHKNQGGDSAGDPPLPIPNREVKPPPRRWYCESGRVGHRPIRSPDRTQVAARASLFPPISQIGLIGPVG